MWVALAECAPKWHFSGLVVAAFEPGSNVAEVAHAQFAPTDRISTRWRLLSSSPGGILAGVALAHFAPWFFFWSEVERAEFAPGVEICWSCLLRSPPFFFMALVAGAEFAPGSNFAGVVLAQCIPEWNLEGVVLTRLDLGSHFCIGGAC